MTQTPNPFEAMMQMGQDWAKAMGPAWEKFSPKAFEDMMPTMSKDMMEAFFGKAINPNGLDAKSRLMITLAGLTITGAQADSQIRLTVRHLVEAGATQQEIAEAIGVAGMFGGAPAMTRAMQLAGEVLTNKEGDA